MKKILNLILRFFKWLFSTNADNDNNEETKQEEEMVKKYMLQKILTRKPCNVL